MRVPSTLELLQAWECGLSQPPAKRALTLLATAWPEASAELLAELPLGRRNARLLSLRETIFGSHLISLAQCPGCDETLELSLEVADLLTRTEVELTEVLSISVEHYEVQFRLPNTRDLTMLEGNADRTTQRRFLLERCILAVECKGELQALSLLPAEVEQAVVAQMARSDPELDIQLALCCPDCAQQWLANFDILSFFWAELNDWACRLLREVHILATAYGWPEAEILALSSQRRQIYLDMINV